jgi:hypothetical protein
MGDLHADGRGQAIAHGAQAARGHPAVRLLEAVELRGPHLVLADFGGDVGVATLGQLVQALDGVLRLDDRLGAPVGKQLRARQVSIWAHQSVRAGLLAWWPAAFQDRDQVFQHAAGVADDRQVDADVLVDRRGVDIDVDLLASPARRRRGAR